MPKTKVGAQPQRIEVRSQTALAIGDAGLLRATTLALVCSQQCSGDAILKTYDFARLVRGSGLAIVSGFHSPIEKDCLPILLRGSDPIIIVQGRRLTTTRLPREWQKAIDAGRLLLLSPFGEQHKRVTTELAAERNRFVVSISDEVLITYASPDSKTEALCRETVVTGKRVYTFQTAANGRLIEMGASAIEPDYFLMRDRLVTSCYPR